MWEPSGKEIYFVSDRSGAENVWRTSTEAGATPVQVSTFTDGRVVWPTLAAHAGTLVFERDFGIWTLDLGSGKAALVPITRLGAPAGPAVDHMTLTSEFHDLALSPDGKKLAFEARGEIFAASAKDGGDAARVTTTAAAENGIVWSPDSRRIVRLHHGKGTAAHVGGRSASRSRLVWLRRVGSLLARRQDRRLPPRRQPTARRRSRWCKGSRARARGHFRGHPWNR